MEHKYPAKEHVDESVSCLQVKENRYTLVSNQNTDAWISSTDTVSLSNSR